MTREQDGAGNEEVDLLGDPEDVLAERLTRLVIDSELEDPAIMQAVQTRVPAQVGLGLGGHTTGPGSSMLTPQLVFQQPGGLNSSIWDSSAVLRRIRGPLLTQVGCWGAGGFPNVLPKPLWQQIGL